MPRVVRGKEAGYTLPGVYERLLRSECEGLTEPDPRLCLGIEPGTDEEAQWDAMVAAGRRAESQMFTERLAAGEPLTVERWRVVGGRNGAPRDAPMFQGPAQLFTVRRDDTIIG